MKLTDALLNHAGSHPNDVAYHEIQAMAAELVEARRLLRLLADPHQSFHKHCGDVKGHLERFDGGNGTVVASYNGRPVTLDLSVDEINDAIGRGTPQPG